MSSFGGQRTGGACPKAVKAADDPLPGMEGEGSLEMEKLQLRVKPFVDWA